MARRSSTEVSIAILTDFGYRDHYVGVMKGVIAGIAPHARIIDITHGIPAQSIMAGSIALRESWHFFPKQTVFLVVVDPGVGTARLPVAIRTKAGPHFVGPDNGVLALAAEGAGVREIVSIDAIRYRLEETSSTFHGRDIFAPAAAFLARGTRLRSMGRRIERIEPLALPEPAGTGDRIQGEVLYADGFGNLVTNISREAISRLITSFPGKQVSVRIKNSAPMKIFNTYGDAPPGAGLATFGSFGLLEIAVRNGSAADRFGCGVGASVVIRIVR